MSQLDDDPMYQLYCSQCANAGVIGRCNCGDYVPGVIPEYYEYFDYNSEECIAWRRAEDIKELRSTIENATERLRELEEQQ